MIRISGRTIVAIACLLAAGSFSQARAGSAAKRTASHSRSRHHRADANVDPTLGDVASFDDPIVREVSVDALGHISGSVVAVDPTSGRILSVVGQKLAFSSGFEPCSTIKPVIALAALEEGVISRDSMVPIGRRRYMNLTEAMAHSNNPFFEELGRRMGFDTISKYARLLGLGEAAGYNLPEEQPGTFPSEPPAYGGVARMSSFGEGIRMTPLQLASTVSTLANGGTLYYLQYPQSSEEIQNFKPRIKRQLNISPLLPELREGMLAAVLYGTARRSYDGDGDQPLGKTGTCNDHSAGGRLGWYVSYSDQEHPKILLVILLRGFSHRISGPRAADVAGRIYRGLREKNYLAQSQPQPLVEQPVVAATPAP